MNTLYFLNHAIRSLRENFAINLVCIITIALAILIFSSFLLVYTNIQGVLDRWSEQIQVIAYLRDDLSKTDLNYIDQEISKHPEVEKIKYVSKDEALERFRESLKGQAGILDGLNTNPLPASIEISLKPEFRTPTSIEKFVDSLKAYAAVEDVQYGQEWVEKFSAFISGLKVLVLAVGGFLLIVSVFIISNTIKLTVFSRREELEILGLVGATDNYIRAPFLIEGAIYGALSSVIALGILFLFYLVLRNKFSVSISTLMGGFDFRFLSFAAVISVLIGGILIGILGSIISVAQFMEHK